jgi:hypothetical protein
MLLRVPPLLGVAFARFRRERLDVQFLAALLALCEL